MAILPGGGRFVTHLLCLKKGLFCENTNLKLHTTIGEKILNLRNVIQNIENLSHFYLMKNSENCVQNLVGVWMGPLCENCEIVKIMYAARWSGSRVPLGRENCNW